MNRTLSILLTSLFSVLAVLFLGFGAWNLVASSSPRLSAKEVVLPDHNQNEDPEQGKEEEKPEDQENPQESEQQTDENNQQNPQIDPQENTPVETVVDYMELTPLTGVE